MKFNRLMDEWKYPRQINTKVEDEIKNMTYDLKKIKGVQIGEIQRKALSAAIRKEWAKHFKKSS